MTSPIPFMGSSQGLGGLISSADFLLNFADLGAGAVDLTPSRGGVSETFTRATAATTVNSAGLIVAVSSGVARSYYDPTSLAYLGYLAEGARTNVVLHNRDLTNAAWVKSNATAAKTQTGADGVANSASSMTATAANGTALQSITLASSARAQSTYIKRLVGSGTIEMTMDNGSTWTAVTVTASWTRVTIPTQTIANPVVGFRIVTSGDSIALDYVQNENGTFESSAIEVAGVAVTRNADVLTYPTTGWLNAAEGTLFVSGQANLGIASGAFTGVAELNDGTASERILLYQFSTDDSIHLLVTDGGVSQGDITPGGAAASFKAAAAYQLNNLALAVNGGTVATDTSATIPTVTTLQIGGRAGASAEPFSTISRTAYWGYRRSDEDLQALTA